jgi:glycosyltransferase involved in cell wall biosynthesis
MSLVSIGMPVYNDVAYIRIALDSLLNQSFSDFELIIIDDQSSDGSYEVCQEYAQNDSRITLLRNEVNKGIAHNMKALLNMAKGEFFMWAANDDVWHHDFIKIHLETLKSNFELLGCFCIYNVIDDFGNIKKGYEFCRVEYQSRIALVRLIKLLFFWNDSIGYGLFRRKEILGMEFPVWWGINKKTVYNVIFPSLFYVLAKGNFALVKSDKVLWSNRWKNKINHTLIYNEHPVRKFFAFLIRKLNVYYCSLHAIHKGNGSWILSFISIFLLLLKFFIDFIQRLIKDILFYSEVFFNKFKKVIGFGN